VRDDDHYSTGIIKIFPLKDLAGKKVPYFDSQGVLHTSLPADLKRQSHE